MRREFLSVLVAILLGTACIDKGAEIETLAPDVADLRIEDGPLADAAAELPGVADTAEVAGDTASPEVAPDESAPEIAAGPTCYEGLHCLVDMKTWSPGKPIPQGGCLEGISDAEMTQVDDLLSCVDSKCTAEFEAFDKGGAGELALLYVCIIEKCSSAAAICIGGQGDKDCGDALYCMSACSPLDQECTIPCLAATSEAQSEKTGKFLDCVFKSCALESLPTCDIPTACVLKCPELAG